MNTIAKLREDMAIIQSAIEGAHIQFRAYGSSEWDKEVGDHLFNFVDYEYRIAPDVVYKMEDQHGCYFSACKPTGTGVEEEIKVTKGYWKEGEAS